MITSAGRPSGDAFGPQADPVSPVVSSLSQSAHASCVARAGHGVLLLGPPGAGKSDLALRLLDRGLRLVADDRVVLVRGRRGLYARPAPVLAGLLEVRGLGVMRVRARRAARVALVVELVEPGAVPRLPEPARWSGLPLLRLDPRPASAAQHVVWALDCVTGRRRQHVGAFAP